MTPKMFYKKMMENYNSRVREAEAVKREELDRQAQQSLAGLQGKNKMLGVFDWESERGKDA